METNARNTRVVTELRKAYPSGVVTDLVLISAKLYKIIRDTAEKEWCTIEEYLTRLGFKVLSTRRRGNLTDEEICTMLLNMYPDKKVHGLTSGERPLYDKVLKKARCYNLTPKEYVHKLGFEWGDASSPNGSNRKNEPEPPFLEEGVFLTKDSEGTSAYKKERSAMVEHMEYLHSVYPTQVVTYLRNRDVIRYRAMRYFTKKREITLENYLKLLGFEYRSEPLYTVEEFMGILKERYSGVIEGLWDTDYNLYSSIYEEAKKEGVSLKDYLALLGYSYKPRFSYTEGEIVEILRSEYKNGRVTQLGNRLEGLYYYIYTLAFKRGISISECMALWGLQYIVDSKAKDITKELQEYYPDGIVKNLQRKDIKLYSNLKSAAVYFETTLKLYLEDLGYRSINLKDDALKGALSAIYADGVIQDLRQLDSKLYLDITRLSRQRGKTVIEYTESLGFKYTSGLTDDIIKKKLLELYPDGNVIGLVSRNTRLFHRIIGYIKPKGIVYKDYIISLGLTYNTLKSGRKPLDSETSGELVTARLLKAYPDRILRGSITADKTLYQYIKSKANQQGMSLKEYLADLGFNREKVKQQTDAEIVSRLLDVYPDRRVVKLSTTDVKLYNEVRKLSKGIGLTVQKYIAKLGFKCVKSPRGNVKPDNFTVDVMIKTRLKQLYPSRVVADVSNRDKRLYNAIHRRVSGLDKTTSEYLSDLGYTYVTRKLK